MIFNSIARILAATLLVSCTSIASAQETQKNDDVLNSHTHNGGVRSDGTKDDSESVSIVYPSTATVDVIDIQFGVDIADPYRWLEDDVRVNEDVAKWVEQQNVTTNAYLGTLSGRDILSKRMQKLFNYERFGLPRKAGSRYFYTRNDGLQNQSILYVRDSLDAEGRILIDPNAWTTDGATALSAWVPSADGTRLIYSIQDGGSDWRTLKVMDVESGAILSDEIEWVKFSDISWLGNDAFLYSRFPKPEAGGAFQSLNLNQTIYYHKLGTPQSADIPIYSTPDNPKLGHRAQTTHDDAYIIITSSSGTDEKYEISIIPIGKGDWKPQKLISGFENDWRLIDGIGDTLYFVTDYKAPRLRVSKADLSGDNLSGDKPVWSDVVAERKATLSDARIVGDHMVLTYLEDAKSLASMVDLEGNKIGEINLTEIGTARGFVGKPGNSETFYSFSSFTQPSAIYRLDTATGKSTAFALPKLVFDPKDYVTTQKFYPSKDGTKIPLFVVHHKDLDLSKGAPTLLYGYGGFNISLTPSYSATRMAWLQSGGVYAQASLRGGGEYGKAWHDAGRLQNKQNVFDDFIAAGEYLVSEGISAKGKLAIEGRSNGGLLVGAVANQRPDLFAAGHAAVGVMDMLRFDRFTAGRYWVDDYGYPNKEADFKNLLNYSPYHNIKSEVQYPALIVTTADTDDRVVPGHSFKYISALQASETGHKPKIIRIESRAGHGSGKPTDKVIAEFSDIYSFLAHWTGLDIKE